MDKHNHDPKHGSHDEHHHHHIVPDKMIFGIGGALLVLTVITVAIAHVDLGRFNFLIAMAVASFKASLVALIFMNLWHDKKENGIIFSTSFIFLTIFMVFSSMDLFFRGDVYVKGPLVASAQAKSKLKNPWISTPELVAHGKELFAQQCVSCHGAEGKGDGAAAAALNPPPRNFTADAGWKNGRKPALVFKTLKEGVAGSAMASFATLPSDDRWALSHYVISLGPNKPAPETEAEFAKAGINPKDAGGGEAEEKVIPVAFAMEKLAQADIGPARLYRPDTSEAALHPADGAASPGASPGAMMYASKCLSCHGAHGEGGLKVRGLGVWPAAYVTTEPFAHYAAMKSPDAFNRAVLQGLPGNLMPANGQLSGAELRDLYNYAKSLK